VELVSAHLGILFVAAIFAGGVNALAGGGTFFSFPALMALGVPAILSNATNAVCVAPGHALAAFVYKRELSRSPRRVIMCTIAASFGAIIGAIIGAWLPTSHVNSIPPPRRRQAQPSPTPVDRSTGFHLKPEPSLP
jgi:uncharacterized membrane protein YfcA